jgi:hypothetical protein
MYGGRRCGTRSMGMGDSGRGTLAPLMRWCCAGSLQSCCNTTGLHECSHALRLCQVCARLVLCASALLLAICRATELLCCQPVALLRNCTAVIS